jgi:hypothetical protein
MKIKIAVAINSEGNWSCAGWGSSKRKPVQEDKVLTTTASDYLDEISQEEKYYFIECEIPVPTPVTETLMCEAKPA